MTIKKARADARATRSNLFFECRRRDTRTCIHLFPDKIISSKYYYQENKQPPDDIEKQLHGFFFLPVPVPKYGPTERKSGGDRGGYHKQK